MRKLLSMNQRIRVREIARESWVNEMRKPKEFRLNQIMNAKMRAKHAIKRDEGFGTGVFASILISIAIKLAIRYIDTWIKNELFSTEAVSPHFYEDN